MDFTQFQKNFNPKKNTDKLTMKKNTMPHNYNNKFKIIFSSFKKNQFQITKLKGIFMQIKHLILNSNRKKEEWIMVFKFKGEIYLILTLKFSHSFKSQLVDLWFQQLINFNKRNNENKKNKSWTLTRKKETLNLWSHKDYKQKIKEKKSKVREEFFKNRSMSKILSKLVKSLFVEKLLKIVCQASKTKFLTNFNKMGT